MRSTRSSVNEDIASLPSVRVCRTPVLVTDNYARPRSSISAKHRDKIRQGSVTCGQVMSLRHSLENSTVLSLELGIAHIANVSAITSTEAQDTTETSSTHRQAGNRLHTSAALNSSTSDKIDVWVQKAPPKLLRTWSRVSNKTSSC